MNTKAINAFRLGIKLLGGISVGYFVSKATDEKANELVDEGGMLNACAIGVGQGALVVASGTLAYLLIG